MQQKKKEEQGADKKEQEQKKKKEEEKKEKEKEEAKEKPGMEIEQPAVQNFVVLGNPSRVTEKQEQVIDFEVPNQRYSVV